MLQILGRFMLGLGVGCWIYFWLELVGDHFIDHFTHKARGCQHAFDETWYSHVFWVVGYMLWPIVFVVGTILDYIKKDKI